MGAVEAKPFIPRIASRTVCVDELPIRDTVKISELVKFRLDEKLEILFMSNDNFEIL